MNRGAGVRLAAVLAALGAIPTAGALNFNFTFAGGTDPNVIAGFTAAGQRWGSLFSDPITINVSVSGSTLLGTTIANTTSSSELVNYSLIRPAFVADATSAVDASVVANLQAGASVTYRVNRTTTNPNGSGSFTKFSATTTQLLVNYANEKALGLRSGSDPTSDASISYNSTLNYDFDPSDGVTVGSYDFIGVMAHELGHVMGFESRASTVDLLGGSLPAAGLLPYNADLLRFTADSVAQGTGIFDIGVTNNAVPFFSTDGGVTPVANFSSGVLGDGFGASHWKNGSGAGIMVPVASKGTVLTISPTDAKFFDAIGYTVVPEAGTWAAGLASLAMGTWVVRRGRARL